MRNLTSSDGVLEKADLEYDTNVYIRSDEGSNILIPYDGNGAGRVMIEGNEVFLTYDGSSGDMAFYSYTDETGEDSKSISVTIHIAKIDHGNIEYTPAP